MRSRGLGDLDRPIAPQLRMRRCISSGHPQGRTVGPSSVAGRAEDDDRVPDELVDRAVLRDHRHLTQVLFSILFRSSDRSGRRSP
jgi:hypothetical protein